MKITLEFVIYNMAELSKKSKNPAKDLSIELFAFNPRITIKEVAIKLDVSEKMVKCWSEEEEYHRNIYKCYMKRYDSKIPAVLDALFETAINDGNVNAAKLILEQGGKLVKNIVNVTVSPYEMFIDKISEVEVIDEETVIDVASEVIDVYPEEIVKKQKEKKVSDKKRSRDENKKIKEIEKAAEYNAKQREWYKWRKRAKEVGVAPLKSKRPTGAQRRMWQEEIIREENAKQESKVQKTSKKS